MMGPKSARQAIPIQYMVPAISGLVFFFSLWLSTAVNLMGLAFSLTMFVSTTVMHLPFVRRMAGLRPRNEPLPTAAAAEPKGPIVHGIKAVETPVPEYAPPTPRATSLSERFAQAKEAYNETIREKTGGLLGADPAAEAAKAERTRREMLKKLERSRREQEKQAFEDKLRRRP